MLGLALSSLSLKMSGVILITSRWERFSEVEGIYLSLCKA